MLNSIYNINKALISDSKSSAVILNNMKTSSKVKPGILIQKTQILSANSHILNCITTTCSSPTIVLLAQPNNQPRTIAADSKASPIVGVGTFSEASKLSVPITTSNLNTETATLSKVITNTQSLQQHQGNKLSNSDNLSVTNSITSHVVISSSCVDTDHEIPPVCNSIDKSTEDVDQLCMFYFFLWVFLYVQRSFL